MTTDFCRFAAVLRFEDLFEHMSGTWSHHFDRYEWTGAIGMASNHIRVSDRFVHPDIEAYDPGGDPDTLKYVLAHQGLAVNGWADTVAARVFLDALNAYGLAHWTSGSSRLVPVVTPFSAQEAAEQVRGLAGSPAVGAVALPLSSQMLGMPGWDPLYEALVEADLPLVIHFSGVEGSYAGAPPLAGAPHTNPLSRHILMPQLAESNIASLIFQGTFMRFPGLRVLFAGFGFRWLPSIMRRMDQEWRNFRSDMPWVRERPAVALLRHVWVGTHPIGEVPDGDGWAGEFEKGTLDRLVFCSNSPFDTDTMEDVAAKLGPDWVDRLDGNARGLLSERAPLTV